MLKLRHLLLTGVALLALTPIVAGSAVRAGDAPSETYANIGNWTITYHPSRNNCSMIQTYDQGTTFFVNRVQGVWNFAFGNPLWSSRMEEGANYKITLILDGFDKWTDSFQARPVNGHGLVLFFDNVGSDFLLSVMRRNAVGLYLTKTGERLTTLPLNNSYAAMLKLVECDQQVAGSGRQPAPQPVQQPRRGPDFST
jgi:hypothetical protein